MSIARFVVKILFHTMNYIFLEGYLDKRVRKFPADVPDKFNYVRVLKKIKTNELDKLINRLITMVEKYYPVVSMFLASISNYKILWEKIT